ncbi:MAG: cold-shock protein [Alphaproteobacteria bacterium]|jgi:CspA family cold shock protein|nr:cold shock domain-containing protein [Alphaproteobacteria bacterium]
MRQGKVKWYNGKKCFGFITPDTANKDGNKEDVFVHSSALKAAGIRFLNENDIVEFDEEIRDGKLSVTTLNLIQRDEESARKFRERRASFRRNRCPQREDGACEGFGSCRKEGESKKPGWKFWAK